MIQLVLRFLTFNAQNLIPEVWVILVVLWVGLVFFSVTSVVSLNISASGKVFWLALIVILPIFGLFIYCIRCIIRSESPVFRSVPPRNKAKAREAEQIAERKWALDRENQSTSTF